MKSVNLAVLIAATTLLISACEENKAPEMNTDVRQLRIEDVNINDKTEDKEFYPGQADKQTDPGVGKKQPQVEKQVKQDWDKKLIKTASLNFEVKDHKNYYSFLREKVRNAGGYIARKEQTQSDYKIENALTVKVPADQFDELIGLLTNSVEKLNEKSISSQDVTAEYVDAKARIEAKKQMRLRYLDLLKQAKNMEEVLSVQAEINKIQEHIESGQGRMEYLDHSSAFSAIHITYYQVVNPAASDDSEPSFATRLVNALKSGWSFTESLFIGLIAVWPLYPILTALIFLYRKFRSARLKQA